MAEFLNIETRGKPIDEALALIAEGLNKTHHCVHTGQAEMRAAHAEATSAREALATKVDGLAGAVGALDTRQDITEGSVSALAQALGGQIQTGTVRIKAKFGWMDWLKFAGAAGGALAIVIFLVQLTVHMGPSIQSGFAAAIAYIMGLDPV